MFEHAYNTLLTLSGMRRSYAEKRPRGWRADEWHGYDHVVLQKINNMFCSACVRIEIYRCCAFYEQNNPKYITCKLKSFQLAGVSVRTCINK